MERSQRRQGHPGREHRSGSSRRPYSDEQETYRNPRNEYDDDRGSEYRQHGRQDEDGAGSGRGHRGGSCGATLVVAPQHPREVAQS